jgi:hypothetical protein
MVGRSRLIFPSAAAGAAALLKRTLMRSACVCVLALNDFTFNHFFAREHHRHHHRECLLIFTLIF